MKHSWLKRHIWMHIVIMHKSRWQWYKWVRDLSVIFYCQMHGKLNIHNTYKFVISSKNMHIYLLFKNYIVMGDLKCYFYLKQTEKFNYKFNVWTIGS